MVVIVDGGSKQNLKEDIPLVPGTFLLKALFNAEKLFSK
jgi:hypothetical protein